MQVAEIDYHHAVNGGIHVWLTMLFLRGDGTWAIPTQDSITIHRLSEESVQVECEDEREPVVQRGVNRTRIIVTCKGDK